MRTKVSHSSPELYGTGDDRGISIGLIGRINGGVIGGKGFLVEASLSRPWRTDSLVIERYRIFESIEYRGLGAISYVYICRALLTTWNVVFNLLIIDLLLATEQSMFLYKTLLAISNKACLSLYVTLILQKTYYPLERSRVVTLSLRPLR